MSFPFRLAPPFDFQDATEADGVVTGAAFAVASQSAKFHQHFRRFGCGTGSRRNGGFPDAFSSEAFGCDIPFALFPLRFAKRIPGASSNAKQKPCSNQISFGDLPLFLPAGKFPAPTHFPLCGWRLFRFLRVRKACWMQCFTHKPQEVAGCGHLIQSPALVCRR